MASGERPTQRGIAARAGISVGAVSRALADDPKIAVKTRQMVQDIAAELGYTPDRAALRLRTGRNYVIYLMLPPHDEIFGFGTSLVRGISNALVGTPYHLVIMPDFGLEDQETAIARVVQNKLADGIIFSRTMPNDARVRYLSKAGFPFICHGRTALATPYPFVDYDNFEFAQKAAQYLIAQGAQHLAIIAPPPSLTFHQHLLDGVRATGAAFELLSGATLDDSEDRLKCAIQSCLNAPNPPDGWICPGEVSGLAALAAAQDAGRVPGRNIHLCAKQTTGLFGLVRPKIHTLYEDLPAAGAKLASLLLRRIAGEAPDSLHYVQPVSHVRPNQTPKE